MKKAEVPIPEVPTETLNKSASGMQRKAHGAQATRHINEIGEAMSTAQHRDAHAQTIIQGFPTLITLLRHGEVAGRASVLRGASEEKLSAHGVAQMQQTLLGIGGAPYDHIATSPLPRCLNFAHDYAAQQQLTAHILPCFGELNFGDWEGLTPSEAHARNPTDYENFQATHGVHPPPQGESLDALRVRVLAGWQAWLAQHEGTNRLLITHAGVIRALLMELFGFTPAQTFQIALPLAATVRISHLPGHPPFLLSIN